MDRLGGFVSLLFSIDTGYLNDDIGMELILDVGHFYVASYSRKNPAVDLLLRWPQCPVLLLVSTVIP